MVGDVVEEGGGEIFLGQLIQQCIQAQIEVLRVGWIVVFLQAVVDGAFLRSLNGSSEVFWLLLGTLEAFGTGIAGNRPLGMGTREEESGQWSSRSLIELLDK